MMKNNKLIITASLLAVLICLILAVLLFYSVPSNFLIILAFIIGIVTGILILAIIISLRNTIQTKRTKKNL
jgi:hypothetical protein